MIITSLTEYVGVLRRTAANIVDLCIVGLLLTDVLYSFYGKDFLEILYTDRAWQIVLISIGLPMSYILFFWIRHSATPGKLLFDLDIVHSETGQNLLPIQALFRLNIIFLIYIAPLVLAGWMSTLDDPFMNILANLLFAIELFGLFSSAFSKRKQAWHDKIAHTVVIVHDEAVIPLSRLEKEGW